MIKQIATIGFVTCTLGLLVSLAFHLVGATLPNWVNSALGFTGIMSGVVLAAVTFLSKDAGA